MQNSLQRQSATEEDTDTEDTEDRPSLQSNDSAQKESAGPVCFSVWVANRLNSSKARAAHGPNNR